MLTIDALREYGANTEEGLARFMKRENMYLKFVGKLSWDQFDTLAASLEAGDWNAAFETAHALKGVLGNLSLTPLYNPMVTMSDNLKNKVDMDYGPLLAEIMEQKDKLRALVEA